METKATHPFEKSGLYFGPFSFESFYVNEKGTSCQHCGAFIKNVFMISDSKGVEFKVGSSCVEKTDPVLYKAVKEARNNYLKQLRQERQEAGLKAYRAKKLEEQANNLLKFVETYPAIFKFLESKKDENDFYFSLFSQVKMWGNLSEKQISAIKKAMEPKPVSQHIGEIGKKIELELTLTFKTFFEGQWGDVNIFVLEDSLGNKVTYKGSGYISMDILEKSICNGEEFTSYKYVPAQVGDKVILTAKVKDHTNYKGTNQTVIERFKVKNIIKKSV